MDGGRRDRGMDGGRKDRGMEGGGGTEGWTEEGGTEGWTEEGGTEGGVRKEAGAREGGKEEGGRGDEKGWARKGNGRMGKRRERGIQLYCISLQDFKGTPSYIFSPDFAYAYRRQHTCFSTSASESAILWFDLTPKTEDQKLAQSCLISDYD